MKVSIFGLGYVGCVSLGCLARNGHDIVGVDVNEDKVNQINSGKATIIEKDIDSIIKEQHLAGRIKATQDFQQATAETEISIIAVGTPSTPQGHLNLKYIFKVAEQFGEALKQKNDNHIIAIRSTIMPGTCEKFGQIIQEISGKVPDKDFTVLSNPEFLREGTAVRDYYNPPLTLIGGTNKEDADTLAKLYTGLPAELIIADTRTAEIMKYVNNTFHALKISFANEIGNICKSLGIDSHEVMSIFTKDKQLNISPYYFKPGFAYGGSCLPKDLKGLQTLAHDNYLNVPVIENIDKTNILQIHKAIEHLNQYRGKRIGFMGLSFKAGTDDLRNSPAVEVIESLLGKGHQISIYDKNINLARLTGTNKAYINDRIPHLSQLLVDDLDTLVEKSDVIVVTTKESEFAGFLKNIDSKQIVDFVRYDDSLLAKENYFGINW